MPVVPSWQLCGRGPSGCLAARCGLHTTHHEIQGLSDPSTRSYLVAGSQDAAWLLPPMLLLLLQHTLDLQHAASMGAAMSPQRVDPQPVSTSKANINRPHQHSQGSLCCREQTVHAHRRQVTVSTNTIITWQRTAPSCRSGSNASIPAAAVHAAAAAVCNTLDHTVHGCIALT